MAYKNQFANVPTLSLSSVGANKLASSNAISDRKLHSGMVDLDPTGPETVIWMSV